MFYQYWEPDMVISHILERHGREPLNSHYYAGKYPSVHAAGIRFWGSWEDVITACGLNYNEIRKYRRWDRERIIEIIKERERQGLPLSSKYIQEEEKPLYMAAIKRFKNWGEALRQSGIVYEDVRLRQQRTAQELKKEIQKLYRSGADLSYTAMRKEHQDLMAASAKKLGKGSWAAARKVCGITADYRSLGQQKRDPATFAPKPIKHASGVQKEN